MSLQNLFCNDEARRAQVADSDTLHGIDYLEVVTEPAALNQRVLEVHFIPKKTTAGESSLNTMLNDLATDSSKVSIQGGVRIKNIKVKTVNRVGNYLRIEVSEPGDFSNYRLVIKHLAMDPVYSWCDFNFKAGCPSRFDCRNLPVCPPEPRSEPVIDYMAKDYASFRQALTDLIPTLVPGWKERHEADLGIALTELMAYVGDYLSYYQDAVANEAYLETARQRISARRHARLIDYRMHDGASARAFIHFKVQSPGTIPAGTQVLARINKSLGTEQPPHGPVLAPTLKRLALRETDAIFETMSNISVNPILSDIPIYTWDNRECCLPRNATSADLVGDLKTQLKEGDFLLFEEVISPDTGRPADADLRHRQVVRLTKVELTHDPPLSASVPGAVPKTLTHVEWDQADALEFPFCLSFKKKDDYIENASVAQGNLVLADHGRTLDEEWFPGDPNTSPPVPGIEVGKRPFRFHLKEKPLSFRISLPEEESTYTPARDILAWDPHRMNTRLYHCRAEARQPEAQVKLEIRTPTATLIAGRPKPDLLGSDQFDLDFVAETESDGCITLRFGDGNFGTAPPDGVHIKVVYRVGVGTRGNVGRESLVHVLNPGTVTAWPDIVEVRNPLPAWGGIEPETIEQVRQLAPAAFRAEQFRAVTEDDYARAAEKYPEVSKAAATFRWTGSWLTVFLTIDPRGSHELTAELSQRVRDWVTCYMQAGYDLEIDPPVFIPLDIEMDICVKPDHFRSDVENAVLAALSNRKLSDGTRGFFHADEFTFGQSLYLSQLYRAVEAVEGVDSAVVTKFQRFGKTPNNELEQAYIPVGRLEIIRLDNDPTLPENGLLRLNMLGGK